VSPAALDAIWLEADEPSSVASEAAGVAKALGAAWLEADEPVAADAETGEPRAPARSITLARVAARAASAKLGRDILALDVTRRLPLTDVFVIVTGANERQVGAIVDAVEESLSREGAERVRREGSREGNWVLLDFGEVVVHVFSPQGRALFALDRLWYDCPPVAVPADPPPVDAPA